MAICYQLCTQGGVAVWKQVAVPENGHQGILLIPVRRRSDRVDIEQGWQGSTWLPAAGPAERQQEVTEVVLKGVTQELDGRRRKVVLFTDQAVRQTVRMRSFTADKEENARNEGLTGFTGQRPG